MQMPLCLPEKITSGPATIGVIGAMEPGPECIGAKGVAKAGGRTPGEGGTETLLHTSARRDVSGTLSEGLLLHLGLESS